MCTKKVHILPVTQKSQKAVKLDVPRLLDNCLLQGPSYYTVTDRMSLSLLNAPPTISWFNN